jgi:transcriptional regulator with XRE-family HTH domain
MSNDKTGIDPALKLVISPDESLEIDSSTSATDTAIRLKLVRDVFGFSQRELAKRAGVTNSSISMIEQGQVSPSIQSLSRILAVFPISLADFFGFKLSADVHACPIEGEGSHILAGNYRQLDAQVQLLFAGQSTAFGAAAVDCCVVVLEGSLQLTLLGGNRLLHQGDSFYILASQPFRLINLSGDDAKFFRCSLFVHKG